MRKVLITVAVTMLMLGGACTSGEGDDTAVPEGTAPTEATAPSASFPVDARADGVTDDTIKLGITYVDLDALGDVVDIDHGDYEAAYQAVIDDINAAGGINGRQIEPVFAPVLPIGTDPADETCVELTEDEGVFAVLGFVLDDAPMCYLELHDTPVVGGVITQARVDRAEAPWVSPLPGAESITERLVTAFANDGVFEGATVGAISLPTDQTLMEDITVPALEAAGIEVVDAAFIDAPVNDQVAALQQVGVIAERFRSEGIDTVVTVGNAALTTAQGLEATDYRPRLAATGFESLATYVGGQAGFDPDIVQDAISGGYATSAVQFEDPAMQDCMAVVEDATGEALADPAEAEPGEAEPWVSVFAACTHLSLFRQIAEAAGDDLNNGTFGQAAYDLGEIEIPGAGGPATYGPDSLDGDMPVYLLRYDEAEGGLVGDTAPTS
jgi:ABC-type branched-subunit amino acid transport system substrate-binding protein